jgi:hypothetical protein
MAFALCPTPVFAEGDDPGGTTESEEAVGEQTEDETLISPAAEEVEDEAGENVITVSKYLIYYCKSSDGMVFTISGSEATLSSYIGTGKTVVIPDAINYNGTIYKVTAIGQSVFESRAALKSVTISGNVKTIGKRAFYLCTQLESVTIGDGVETIGDRAFAGCSSLTSVTIPGSVETIGKKAFNDCYDLESVTIEDGVESIGEDAFNNCKSLESVTVSGDFDTSLFTGTGIDPDSDIINYYHNWILIDAKDATCQEAGNTAYWYCDDCGKYCAVTEDGVGQGEEIEADSWIIPAKGHTPADLVIENEVKGTCLTEGSYDKVVYCAVCGEEISRETVANGELTDHKWSDWDENGVHTCEVCGETEQAQAKITKNNETTYVVDLAEALSAWENGAVTVDLLADVAVEAPIEAADDLTLNLNDHTLTADIDSKSNVNINNGFVSGAISNTAADSEGTLTVNSASLMATGEGIQWTAKGGIVLQSGKITTAEGLPAMSVSGIRMDYNSTFDNSNGAMLVYDTDPSNAYAGLLHCLQTGYTGKWEAAEDASEYVLKVYDAKGEVASGWIAKGEDCEHSYVFENIGDEIAHSRVCKYCGQTTMYVHNYKNGVCTVCNYVTKVKSYDVEIYIDGQKDATQCKTYEDGTVVTAKAKSTTTDGKKFSHWAIDSKDGNVLSYSNNYSFRASSNMVLYAVYVDADAKITKEPSIAITSVYTSGTRIVYEATRDVPTEYSVVETGVLYGYNDALMGDGKADTYLRFKNDNGSKTPNLSTYRSASVGKQNKGCYIFRFNVGTSMNRAIYVRGYVIVKKADGNTKTYYSKVTDLTYNEVGK